MGAVMEVKAAWSAHALAVFAVCILSAAADTSESAMASQKQVLHGGYPGGVQELGPAEKVSFKALRTPTGEAKNEVQHDVIQLYEEHRWGWPGKESPEEQLPGDWSSDKTLSHEEASSPSRPDPRIPHDAAGAASATDVSNELKDAPAETSHEVGRTMDRAAQDKVEKKYQAGKAKKDAYEIGTFSLGAKQGGKVAGGSVHQEDTKLKSAIKQKSTSEKPFYPGKGAEIYNMDDQSNKKDVFPLLPKKPSKKQEVKDTDHGTKVAINDPTETWRKEKYMFNRPQPKLKVSTHETPEQAQKIVEKAEQKAEEQGFSANSPDITQSQSPDAGGIPT